MTFKDTFCPSPWFHMRINNSGSYEYCRWASFSSMKVDFKNNIQTESPLVFFQKTMAPLRQKLLNGETINKCQECYTMEQHGKVSGRQRQLLKIGVMEDCFEPSLASSPMRLDFDYSNENNGHTLRTVTDWQIDLGNYCNSACIFCSPGSSSRLATEFLKLGIIDQAPPANWCDDPELLNRFIVDLVASPNLQYLHFIGGETLITPAFEKILTALVEADLAKNITVGFTTNLTIWSDSIENLLIKFKQINLGMSVETLTPVNEYLRYPARLDRTLELLDRWRKLGELHQWLIQLRITPTCLSVQDLVTIYDYAWTHNIAVESCNFLYHPGCLRIGVLPTEYRQRIQEQLATWIKNHHVDTHTQIVNTRDPNQARAQIQQDAESYLNYLINAEDESFRLPELVKYLKTLEGNRKNSILTYLPEYEDLFRSAGY